ncbi:MAG: hypothetical protein AAF517_19165, partial [Planctomycetota bacterium]
SKDPGESKDLSKEKPELTAKLRAELDAWQESTEAPIPKERNPQCTLQGPIVKDSRPGDVESPTARKSKPKSKTKNRKGRRAKKS